MGPTITENIITFIADCIHAVKKCHGINFLHKVVHNFHTVFTQLFFTKCLVFEHKTFKPSIYQEHATMLSVQKICFNQFHWMNEKLQWRNYLIAKDPKQSLSLLFNWIMWSAKVSRSSKQRSTSVFIFSSIFAAIFSQLSH